MAIPLHLVRQRLVRTASMHKDSWSGHYPVTAAVLLRLLEREAADRRAFTYQERLFCTLCEFWAAVRNRELFEHLGSDPLNTLINAGFGFHKIGVPAAAARIAVASRGWRVAMTPGYHRRCATALEDSLLETTDTIDQRIARFAVTLVREGVLDGYAGQE